MSVAINDFAKKAYSGFVNAGMTKVGACCMLGNIYAESGMIANRVEILCLQRLKEYYGITYNDATYTAAVDSGKISRSQFLNPIPGRQYGYGATQLTSPSRKAGLYDRTVAVGKSIADEQEQIAFVIYELKNSYQSVWNVLKSTNSIKEGSDKVLKDFEIPANWQSLSAERASYSQQYYDYFKSYSVDNSTKGSGNVANTTNNTSSVYYVSGGNMVSNSGQDEWGGYTGGSAGDQSGKEWYIRSFYIYPWNCVLRHPDINVRHKISELGIKAAKNDNVGYNQGDRYSYWSQLQKNNYDPTKINVKCNSDCSAGVIANTKAAGYLLGISSLQNIWATYTGNMRQAYKEAGFQVLTESKYLNSPDYLVPGDILLNDVNHVCTFVSIGAKSGETASSTPSSPATKPSGTSDNPSAWSGTINKEGTAARTWAGSEYPEVSFSPLKKGTKVEVQYDLKSNKGNKWYFVKVGDKFAFVYAGFVTKDKATKTKAKKQYRVQVGVFDVKANAITTMKTVKKMGFDAVVVTVDGKHIVQVGIFDSLNNAKLLKEQIEQHGIDAAIIAINK